MILIKKFPILKRNALYYNIQRFRQYLPLKVDKALTEYPEVIDVLLENGIHIIEGFLSKGQCEQILKELEVPKQQALNNKWTSSYITQKEIKGNFRIGSIDQFSHSANKLFFQNKLIVQTARAYVSKKARSYRREVDFKLTPGNLLQSDLPHFDDWRHRFKAFLYLTDVDQENAPFVYYKGSHKQE